MSEFTEDVITKIANPKAISLTKVAAAGFDVSHAATGTCPKCEYSDGAYVFIKDEGKEALFVLACPHCGARVKGYIGSTKFNTWLDKNINKLTERRAATKLPLVRKVLTQKKASLTALYR